jgi:ribosomal protein S18 acetylase RimI-like enzyme
MSEIVIRRARAEDVPAVVRLWREMWDFHAPLDPRFQATPAADGVMERWIEDDLVSDRAAVFVAEEGGPGALAGYCHVLILENPPVVPWQFYGYVSEIAVRRRRAGIGGKLLQAAHEWFRARGLPYVEVNVSVRNEMARGFWRKHGYGDFLERLRREL